jgi:hypothetical protein
MAEKIMQAFISHDAFLGALPTLRAATARDAASGSYFAPLLSKIIVSGTG